MRADPHPRQEARLATLRQYGILDTPRESDFDELVALAARVCDMPISLVSLVDKDRQWFKAETGLGVSETPLDQSICSHVLLENALVEIPDTHADARTRDNPLCVGEDGLRFYAGAPLQTAEGLPIGTLCVLDRKPRTLTPEQREALAILARQVMTQLDLRRAIAAEQVLRNEMDHRIKNSLSTVAAFVQLERKLLEEPAAGPLLDRVAQQIHTVSALHRQLSDRGSRRVDLADYLAEIVALIAQSQPPSISVTGRFDPRGLDAREAGILGTIVNELVANAVKHSVGEDGTGSIRLTGEALEDRRYRLTCEDDGRGPVVAAAPRSRSGLGLRLISSSVQQLHGTHASAQTPTGYRTEILLPAAAG